MPKRSVLLLGATGEAGRDILDGLVEDGDFDVSLLVRPLSAQKAAIKKLRTAGFHIILSDLTEPVEELSSKVEGFETVISAIDSSGLLAQQNLINAASKAGTRRFLPCAYGPVCPPGGVMQVRDTKETIFNAVLVAKLPYTIVDVGFWYQASFPTVPSGRMDYATLFPNNTMYGDGEAPKILTDKRDAGRLIARIIKDDRTLNRKVVTVGEVLSQKQTVEMVERVSGEMVGLTYVSTEELLAQLDAAKTEAAVPGAADGLIRAMRLLQYHHSMYVRKDNTPENAKYLGYLDTRELYPDFKTRSFENLVKEVLDGKGKKIYAEKFT